MNTTPADAGELAATIAGRTRVPGVTRVICPPFVCLAAVRDALAGDRTSRSGPRTSITSWPARTPARSRAPMLDGLATWVIVGHCERRRDARRDRRADRPRSSAGRVEAGLRPILCVGEQLEDRERRRRGGRGVVDGQLRGALDGHDPATRWRGGRPRHRLRAGLGDRDRPERARLGRRRDGRGDPARARRHRLGSDRAERRPDPLRRQRHRGEHRRVPGRARDRRGARRRRVAQARRDGRDRRPRRRHRGRPPGRDRRDDARPARRGAGRPRPIVLVVIDGFGIGPVPGGRRDRRRGDAGLARPARPLAAQHAAGVRGRRRPAAPARWATPRSAT